MNKLIVILSIFLISLIIAQIAIADKLSQPTDGDTVKNIIIKERTQIQRPVIEEKPINDIFIVKSNNLKSSDKWKNLKFKFNNQSLNERCLNYYKTITQSMDQSISKLEDLPQNWGEIFENNLNKTNDENILCNFNDCIDLYHLMKINFVLTNENLKLESANEQLKLHNENVEQELANKNDEINRLHNRINEIHGVNQHNNNECLRKLSLFREDLNLKNEKISKLQLENELIKFEKDELNYSLMQQINDRKFG